LIEEYNDPETLASKYEERKQYVEDRKPYWLNLRNPYDGELQYELNNYWPDFHYRKAMEQAEEDGELLPDGGGYADLHNGKRNAKVYYWLDPETGSALEHTGVNDEQTIPFFEDEATAKEYLERRADTGEKESYEKYSLYQARAKKVGDAVDVLTDQSGIDDFMADGGYPVGDDGLQLEDHEQDEKVWFWYNPASDHIVQEQVVPYDVRALFDSEDDAMQFADWYAEQYGLDDTAHLELYSAEVSYEGQGRSHVPEGQPGEERDPPEQADLDAYTDNGGGDDDLVTDGGLDYSELEKVQMTRVLRDPVIVHPPTKEAAPPKDEEVYDKITVSRLLQAKTSDQGERITEATWPETMVYLHTLSFDGTYDSPELEQVFRESFRRYVDEWTDHDPEHFNHHYAFADPDLSPELESLLDDVKRGIKLKRDEFFLDHHYDEVGDTVPERFWEVDPEEENLEDVIEEFQL